MIKHPLRSLFLFLVCFLPTGVCTPELSAQLPIPALSEANRAEECFYPGTETPVEYSGDPGDSVLSLWTNGFRQIGGFAPETALLGKSTGKINLIDDLSLEAEAYILDITENGIICHASGTAGYFYAFETLRSLITTENGIIQIPAGTIRDTPRYEWRGVMLDVSRHFFDKEVVFNLLDIMALLKMNRFHLHLTDETGWRVEIKKYPKLTEEGATGNWSDRNAPRRFYTQNDIREIVAYAAERQIMVIPEIDMPGHATAVWRAYPEFSAGGEGRWAGFTFHPAREETYAFIDDVLTEIAGLFPAPYIHIGGDEVHYGNQVWFTDPQIQGFINEHGLGDEKGLEQYFVRRVCEIVNRKGKKMIGWDEVLSAGITPEQAIVMWWRHDKPELLDEALEKGFQVILCPRLPCYMDFVQDDAQRTGRRWGSAFNTLEKVYAFPESLNNPDAVSNPQVLGIQACTWTERIADPERLYYMLFPRLFAIAENGWSAPDRKAYDSFTSRLKRYLEILDNKGIYYYNPFVPESSPEPWGPDKQDVLADG